MNFDAVQQSWIAYQAYFNQDMASKGPTVTDNSTACQYIDLETVGRQPILSHSLESYQGENGVVHPRYENKLIEKSNQEAMICLTDFRNNSNQMKQDLPRKRLRTTFSPSQLKRLESEFCSNMYVVGLKRLLLAQELQLEERHIKIWFQNRRMKFKRDQRLRERNAGMQAFQNYCFY